MKRTLTIEHSLYLLAFLTGLFLRFFRLGIPVLSEAEAGWAMQALQIARGGSPQIGSQPAYVLLTAVLFWLIGITNFLARFLPALVGSLLIFLPYLFRQVYKDSVWLRKAGLVMAFGLALDPGLVALSRQAGNPILALTFFLLTLAMFVNRRWALVGIFGGLALLSGPALITGLLSLFLTWVLIQVLVKLGWVKSAQIALPETAQPPTASYRALLAFGLIILVAGLLFLRVPQGLGGLTQTIPDYLDGWLKPGDVPALRLPAALLFYQPLALLFGLAAALRGWIAARSGLRSVYLVLFLSLWALMALLLAFIYPSRQVADLAWMLIPLWALAAMEISHHLLTREDQPTRLVALGLAGLVLLLMIISWVNLLTLVRLNGSPILYGALIIGALVMAVIAALLIAFGWSYPAARLGFNWGLILGLGLGMISSTVRLSQLRPMDIRELWSVSPMPGQVAELTDTIQSLSNWNTGYHDQLDVLITVDSDLLRWVIRDYPNVTFASNPDAAGSPAVVITWKDQESPALAQAYRGQDLILHWYPGWQGALPSPILPWLTYHQAPLAQVQAVLWARVDIFPGGILEMLELNTDDELEFAPEDQWVP